MTWEECRARLGLVCAFIAGLFVASNALRHRWTTGSVLWIIVGAAGAWFFLVYLPQGDRQRRLQHVRTLGDLLACTPHEFERRVGDILAETGYRSVTWVGGAGDLAADLTCRDQSGKTVVVQCKRYAPGNQVGSPAIQQFIGMMAVHHKADKGVYVTTSEYSRPAIDLARRHGITLIGGRDLTDLVHKIQARQNDGNGAKPNAQ